MSTRERVLAALRAAGERGVSGEEVARALGVSRVAVAKHVAALRRVGYRIAAAPGAGYRLLEVPDLAVPWEVAPLVADPLWQRFEGGVETASTNDDARRLAEQGAVEGTVVVAARQHAGRGRFGRSWSSPHGGVYLSCVLRPGVSPAETGPLPLVIALGIARALDALGAGRCRLKWPNDVYLGDGKVAGVLLEMSAEADAVRWVVAGFGVNVVRPDEPPPGAAYVRDRVAGVSVPAVAAACLDHVASAYRAWLSDGFDCMRGEYERRLLNVRQEVVILDVAGVPRAAGLLKGVDRAGRLVLEGDAGELPVASGEVSLRRAR